jgi:acyl carrier protein
MDTRFLNLFKKALDMNYAVNDKTIYFELPEWDSLSQLSLIAELDSEYGVIIDTKDLSKLSTIEELYQEVMKRSSNG